MHFGKMAKDKAKSLFHRRRGYHIPPLTIKVSKEVQNNNDEKKEIKVR